ncbi:hypothetical protein BH11PLA2_BH11PLA2_34390 [soil metagenome]
MSEQEPKIPPQPQVVNILLTTRIEIVAVNTDALSVRLRITRQSPGQVVLAQDQEFDVLVGHGFNFSDCFRPLVCCQDAVMKSLYRAQWN